MLRSGVLGILLFVNTHTKIVSNTCVFARMENEHNLWMSLECSAQPVTNSQLDLPCANTSSVMLDSTDVSVTWHVEQNKKIFHFMGATGLMAAPDLHCSYLTRWN